jgi:hypothetical protein
MHIYIIHFGWHVTTEKRHHKYNLLHRIDIFQQGAFGYLKNGAQVSFTKIALTQKWGRF